MPEASEIEIHFFELCNLRCQFCGQDHEAREGMDSILSKTDKVIEFISQNSCHSHILNLMGGELFSDELPDSIFNDYFAFAQKIYFAAKEQEHDIHINWVSNLIFKKSDRVSSFLQKLDQLGISTKISTSYDFAGRRNNLWSQDLFKKNLEIFKEKIYTVGFVLTKPAIDHLIHGSDEFFEYLYANYPLYFDFYVPENSARVLMPSDQEILESYLYIAKAYPNISPVKELVENEENKMTCYSLNKLTLLPSGREVKCRYMDYTPGVFKNPVDYLSNDNIIESFIEENQCLTCPWFSRCSFRCFVQADWKAREKNEECLFKTFFNTIEETPVGTK